MRALTKTVLRALLSPVLRVLGLLIEDWQHIWSYVLLSSRVRHPVDASVVVQGTPEVRGTGDIRFGRDLLLYPDLYLETQEKGSIDIGDEVVMSRGVHVVSHAGIRIGAGTMIGEYTSIRDANHVRDNMGRLRNGAHFSAAISIGSQVWICRGVTILAGVTIGDNATIGANAVVTRNVAPGATVVGIPAAPIRSARESSPLDAVYGSERRDDNGLIGSYQPATRQHTH